MFLGSTTTTTTTTAPMTTTTTTTIFLGCDSIEINLVIFNSGKNIYMRLLAATIVFVLVGVMGLVGWIAVIFVANLTTVEVEVVLCLGRD